MTRREELQEAYEDAMFALLMDYVAESEGEKALEENRVLQEDPDAEVPQGVRRACLKEIHRAFRKKSARSVGRITMKVINKVALVALLGTLLFSTAFTKPEKMNTAANKKRQTFTQLFQIICFCLVSKFNLNQTEYGIINHVHIISIHSFRNQSLS